VLSSQSSVPLTAHDPPTDYSNYEVPLVRGVTLAAGAALVLGPSLVTAQDKPKEEQEIIIPASAMPPEGMCRVWLKDVPERSQPAATDCATAIKSRPRDAMLLLGEPSRNAKLPLRRPTRLTGVEDRVGSLRSNDPMADRRLNSVDRSASLLRQQGSASGTQAQAATTRPTPVPAATQGAVKAAEPTKAAVVVKPPQ
jgi:hypothetical protein